MNNALTVPSNLVQVLRGAVISELGNAASAIAAYSEPGDDPLGPDDLAEMLEELDSLRALLDVIGLDQEGEQGPLEVDVDAHRAPLRTALESELAVRREFLEVDPTFAGASQQRERAARDVRGLEAVLADLDARE